MLGFSDLQPSMVATFCSAVWRQKKLARRLSVPRGGRKLLARRGSSFGDARAVLAQTTTRANAYGTKIVTRIGLLQPSPAVQNGAISPARSPKCFSGRAVTRLVRSGLHPKLFLSSCFFSPFQLRLNPLEGLNKWLLQKTGRPAL
jgi:hypothetical protein